MQAGKMQNVDHFNNLFEDLQLLGPFIFSFRFNRYKKENMRQQFLHKSVESMFHLNVCTVLIDCKKMSSCHSNIRFRKNLVSISAYELFDLSFSQNCYSSILLKYQNQFYLWFSFFQVYCLML